MSALGIPGAGLSYPEQVAHEKVASEVSPVTYFLTEQSAITGWSMSPSPAEAREMGDRPVNGVIAFLSSAIGFLIALIAFAALRTLTM